MNTSCTTTPMRRWPASPKRSSALARDISMECVSTTVPNRPLRLRLRPQTRPDQDAHSVAMRFDPKPFVPWIRAAAPYIHALRGNTIVIAFCGEVVADETFLGVVHDLNLLHSLGTRLVVVHGSRPQIEAILKQQSIPSRYHRGLRITDAETMDYVLVGVGHTLNRIDALLSLGIANSPMADARIPSAGGNFITA